MAKIRRKNTSEATSSWNTDIKLRTMPCCMFFNHSSYYSWEIVSSSIAVSYNFLFCLLCVYIEKVKSREFTVAQLHSVIASPACSSTNVRFVHSDMGSLVVLAKCMKVVMACKSFVNAWYLYNNVLPLLSHSRLYPKTKLYPKMKYSHPVRHFFLFSMFAKQDNLEYSFGNIIDLLHLIILVLFYSTAIHCSPICS